MGEPAQKKTVVIHLWGSSGVGKSAAQGAIFAELKYRGYHCEKVNEYVKEWAWEGRIPSKYDQPHIFGVQCHRESTLYGKLDVLVSDSPLLFSAFYEQWHHKVDIVLPSVLNFMKFAEENNVQYLNFWLEEHNVFDSRGRYETEEQSKAVHSAMKKWVQELGIQLISVTAEDRKRADFIVDYLESRGLGKNNQSKK